MQLEKSQINTMFIDTDILITWGGASKKLKKGDYIFHEGERARFYYQIISGRVKMFNINYDGREFTQAEFTDGESFGEPPLFIDVPYPATAQACEDTVLIKIEQDKFDRMLTEYPALQRKLIALLAMRIYRKSSTLREIVNNAPEARILAFLNWYKKEQNPTHKEVEIPFTRQEIANYTGLRVETIIRTLSKMQDKKQVKIVNRKLFY